MIGNEANECGRTLKGHAREDFAHKGERCCNLRAKMEEHSSIGDINSAVAAEALILRKKRICLVGATCNDPALNAAAQQFKVSVFKSETGTEYVKDTSYCTYFVLKQFEGLEYDALRRSAHRILGPTALLQLAEKKDSLPSIRRPMYTQAMKNTVVVFSGFRARKDELRKLANMVLSMGGSIRREMSDTVTHLIAHHCGGEKYRYADMFGVHIMLGEWVIALWSAKNDVSCDPNNKELIESYKLKPLYGAKVCFFGFPEEEKKHMCEVLEQQGGESTEIDDPSCTHVVVDVPAPFCKKSNNAISELSYFKNSSTQNPLLFMPFKPVSSPFYYPHLNAFCTTKKAHTRVYNDILSIDSVDSIKTPNNYSSSMSLSLMSKPLDVQNKQTNSIFDNISQDSAISMDDNCSDLQNSIIKSGTIFHNFVEQSDSGVDINKSSNLSTAFSMSNNRSSLTTSTLINDKKIKYSFSESSLSSMNDQSLYEITSNHTAKLDDLKSPQFFIKNNVSNVFTSSMNNNALSLKYRNNIHYIQNNTSMTKRNLTPKRYVKWRKTNSCTSVHKMATLEKHKFMKTRSYPNILKRCEGQYSDTFLHNALVENSRHLSKSHASIFSKIGNFSFCSTFPDNEHNTCVDSYYSPPEKTLFKKKYTSLSKSFPIITKISNTKHNSRNIPTFNGKSCNLSSPSYSTKTDCTGLKIQEDKSLHMVVDESNVNVLPDIVSVSAFVVKTGWFWTSVQNEAAVKETDHLFNPNQQNVTQSVVLPKHPYWLGGQLSNLLQNGADSPASVSGSFLDCTASPDKQLPDEVEAVGKSCWIENVKKNLSQRHQVFRELVDTESNYVKILKTIMDLFKSPLEQLIEENRKQLLNNTECGKELSNSTKRRKYVKELLNSTEIKIIFGNFPPIYDVHKQLLEALENSDQNWKEEISIGEIFLKFEPDLVKAYPPYINFFENTKQMLDQCDQNKPRFHAFLKNCQTDSECSRQSLKELLIKPVQRLPSISLLLNDILKHTDKSNPDYSALEASINCIKNVMTYINEDKRKTERQLAMFDIFNEIDNCPPHLVSSHRSFISKCDVMERTEGFSGRGDHLVLFLFTDTLEICKKRSKAFNSLKSPNTVNGLQSSKLSQGKPYKHVKMLSLNTIRRVVDIREIDECHKGFVLRVRGTQELQEQSFSFIITDEEINKTNYLQTLCRQIAIVLRIADADSLLISCDLHQFEAVNDVASGTLKKTIKFASRTRARVGRAFSFNKTPSKLNRAMSTIMSPFGVPYNLATTNQHQMRLGSCNNINCFRIFNEYIRRKRKCMC